MLQHKAIYFPEKKDNTLEQIELEIMRDDEFAQVNQEIRHLNFRETLLYHMKQMSISKSKLIDLCENILAERTIQRMLSTNQKIKTIPKRETIILICMAMNLPASLSINLVEKAGYSFKDGMTGKRLQKLLQHKMSSENAKKAIEDIMKIDRKEF